MHAVVTKMYDQARAAMAAGLPDGPFTGVPFMLKDLGVLYAGVRTTNGSRLFVDFVADHDSTLVARYKAAGLVIMAKTNTPEFGIAATTEPQLFGPTRNFLELQRTRRSRSAEWLAIGTLLHVEFEGTGHACSPRSARSNTSTTSWNRTIIAVKRITRPMLGFKSFHAARQTLVGIERMHMLKKTQGSAPRGNDAPSAAEQCSSLAVEAPHRQGNLPLYPPEHHV
jgi:hypothetical protein